MKKIDKEFWGEEEKVEETEEMSVLEYNLIWTSIWFIFIFLLCLIFNNAAFLLLLIVWLFGMYVRR